MPSAASTIWVLYPVAQAGGSKYPMPRALPDAVCHPGARSTRGLGKDALTHLPFRHLSSVSRAKLVPYAWW
jgi:hypothetical protein